MHIKDKVFLFIVILLIIASGCYLFFINLNKNYLPNNIFNTVSLVTDSEDAILSLNYLISLEDKTKYCNGIDMDSIGYQKTIITKRVTSTPNINQTIVQSIKTILTAATEGMCQRILSQADITENNGTVYIPTIDAWAGSSIVMCSCKPQVELNLLQIPGITKVIWSTVVSNFEDCVTNGGPIMESYPRQCRYENTSYAENIGNELEKIDLITISSPRPNQIITSPLIIKGQARGSWFFEASFPVLLVDWDGLIIAEGIAQAKDDWMTTEFVPFEATLIFAPDKNVYSNRGALIFRKDNPSGISKYDDALEIPITISGNAN